MKQLLLLLLIFNSTIAESKNFYISAKGADSNTGLTQATAWQTITKLNASFGVIAPGDSILFKCGETFYGSIIIGKSGISGNPIVISSYGIGAQPLITALTTLSSWTSIGGGVYQISAPTVKSTVNMVTINDVPQEVGRFPNSDAANGGYLTATSFTGNTTMTATGLSGTNWTGAEIVARKRAYVIERDKIISQSGGTVAYTQSIQTINPRNAPTPASDVPSADGFGMFVQRDARTLDKFGEWFFDSTTKLISIYFGAANPASYSIKASTLDTLINIDNKNYITVNNLNLTGANMAAVFYHDNTNISVTNCIISNIGAKAIFGWYSFNNRVSGNTITNSMCSGIDVRGPANDLTVTNNSITNIALFKGMASFFDPADARAIYIEVGSNGLVRKNVIDSIGYNGIQFDGANITIDSNFINHYCMNRDDGGAIYTFSRTDEKRIIKNNIILNGIGARHIGTAEDTDCHGIYIDGGGRGVDIINNSIGSVGGTGFGIFLNSPKDISVSGNTIYNASGWYVGRQYNDSIYNFSLKKNIVFNIFSTQTAALHTHTGLNTTTTPIVKTIQESLRLIGYVDSNYYNLVNPTPFDWYYAATIGGAFTFPAAVTFATWKSYSGLDTHSLLAPTNTLSIQRFEYNASNVPKTITLDAIYIGVDSNVFNGSITLPPYTSAVLIKSGVLQTSLKADAGTDISLVLPINNTVLKGSAVGAVKSYSWTKISGPDQFTIATPNNPSTAISNLSTGKYTFQFKVINSVGDSAVAMVNVTETGLLPVTLIDFSAKNNNDKIDLQWQVASEINASHYTIERSGDYQHFESIGQLAANDLANIQVNYNFSDNFPLKGNNYYRLVMIDKDGTFSYSKIVSVEVKNTPSFTLFNVELSTSNSNLKINLTTNYQQKMQLVLADVTGRIIYTNQLQLQKGFNAIDKKIPAINTGVYYAKLFTEQLTVTKPVLSFH
jgi:hypothetical protein